MWLKRWWWVVLVVVLVGSACRESDSSSSCEAALDHLAKLAVINGQEEVGVVVYVDDGKITALEGYTFGGRAWPNEVREFEIQQQTASS